MPLRMLVVLNLSRRIIPIVLLISFSAFPPSAITTQDPSKLPDWKPNQLHLDRLDAARSVDEFLIRPPKGYIAATRIGPFGSEATGWAGPPRGNGTRPQVMLLWAKLPPEELKKYSLEQMLDELVAGLALERENWQRTPPEKGMINGVVFVRTRWSGKDRSLNHKLHGFVYVALLGEKVVQLSSQDVEPHHQEALELAESSALTFKWTSGAGADLR